MLLGCSRYRLGARAGAFAALLLRGSNLAALAAFLRGFRRKPRTGGFMCSILSAPSSAPLFAPSYVSLWLHIVQGSDVQLWPLPYGDFPSYTVFLVLVEVGKELDIPGFYVHYSCPARTEHISVSMQVTPLQLQRLADTALDRLRVKQASLDRLKEVSAASKQSLWEAVVVGQRLCLTVVRDWSDLVPAVQVLSILDKLATEANFPGVRLTFPIAALPGYVSFSGGRVTVQQLQDLADTAWAACQAHHLHIAELLAVRPSAAPAQRS